MAKTKYTPQDIIGRWHRAMRINPDLARDLRECATAVARERARRAAGAGGQVDRVVAAASRWVWIRFAAMWSTAPRLPLHGLQRALDRAVVVGAWDAAREPLLEHLDVARVHLVVRAHARDLCQPYLGDNEYTTIADYTAEEAYYADPVAVVLLLPRRGGFAREEAHRMLDRALDHVEGHGLVRPSAGDHGVGDLPDWANDVTLYRLWRQYQDAERAAGRRPTQAAFVDDVTAGKLPIQRAAARLCRRPPARLGWLDTYALRSAEKKLTAVKRLYGPDPNTPPLTEFLKGR
jgi:hypothetical protein